MQTCFKVYFFHLNILISIVVDAEYTSNDTTMMIRLSEKTNGQQNIKRYYKTCSVIYNELPSYSYSEVMSDVGGAGGLILGLNLWLIIQGNF